MNQAYEPQEFGAHHLIRQQSKLNNNVTKPSLFLTTEEGNT